jgi:hypothetical protein
MDNQRRAKRHTLVRFVWFRIIDEYDAQDAPLEGIAHSCDIARGGIGVVTAHPYPLGTRLFVEIATRDRSISAVGEVVHSMPTRDENYRVGVRFVVVPPNDRILLRQLCTEEGIPGAESLESP